MEAIQKLPEEWAKDNNIHMRDPDGWRNARKSWFDPCTEAEFEAMLVCSTYSQGSTR